MKPFSMLMAVLCIAPCGVAWPQDVDQSATPKEDRARFEIHVAIDGSDQNDGSAQKPIASLDLARIRARKNRGTTVLIHAGTYRVQSGLQFTDLDSGTEFRGAPGEKVIFTRDRLLNLQWKPYRNGIWQADLGMQSFAYPNLSVDARPQSTLHIDELFVNGIRQRMARYPNHDPAIRVLGGFAADAISRQRADRWTAPHGYVHALHPGEWGGIHAVMRGKDKNGDLLLTIGRQNNRGDGLHPVYRFAENIFEELDAPGEWFQNTQSNTLYFMPPEGLDLATAKFEFPTSSRLVTFDGTQQKPVKDVTLRGITFRHAARTFLQTSLPLLRSDWTIACEGAVLLEGTENCAVVDCEFDQTGGNAIFVNKYNRRLRITGCHIHNCGASGVAFVGDLLSVRSPLFSYEQRQSLAQIDQEPGPKSQNYPSDCVVEDSLIHGIGLVEKQAAGVQIAMSANITVKHCSIYDASRAGINIGDGCWGGHLIEDCDVFGTVQETGDHGSFNSWGRDRYWGLKDTPTEALPDLARLDAVKPTILRHNRWRCDHGWDVDLDDGSSNYIITNNVFLRGGLKLREGFHRQVTNNIGVGCGFHPHVWYHVQGEGISNDEVTRNIWAGAYAPAIMPAGKWGREIDFNLFTTSDADRTRFQAHGCDGHSLAGDPLFVNRETGDYRVRDGSPAIQLGFQNFPMDDFGVRKPALKKIARTPKLPGNEPIAQSPARPASEPIEHFWRGAIVRNLVGNEYSAFGVSKDAGGVVLKDVPSACPAAANGFRTGDLIQSINLQPVKTVSDLFHAQNTADGKRLTVRLVRAQAGEILAVDHYAFANFEAADADGFKRIPLNGPQHVVPITAVTTQPAVNNEVPQSLVDGNLARNYGPVFGNGVHGGLYKVDLGQQRQIGMINTWSFNQNGNRGPQHFTLFGSTSDSDPGWNTSDRKLFTPLIEVDATDQPAGPFQVSSIRATAKQPLGQFRYLIWQMHPVTSLGENSSIQEIQVIGP